MSEINQVGTKIKKQREFNKLSVEKLAEQSGVSVELIEKLEAGELVPSLAPLFKIARGLGVRLGTFLDVDENPGPIHTKCGASQEVVRFSGNTNTGGPSGLDFHSLAASKSDRHMEPFVIDVHPASAENPTPSNHEGEEFLYVLAGTIEVIYGKETYILETGDSLYYDSVIPHHVHAKNGDARLLAVVFSPI